MRISLPSLLLSLPIVTCLAPPATRSVLKEMIAHSAPSKWVAIPQAPADKILGLNEEFLKDEASGKISLGVGAYRDDNGKPLVLDSVREARRLIEARNMDHEYTGIAGIPAFVKQSMVFAYGVDAEVIKSNRIAAVQTLSGTGACRLVGEFLAKFMGVGTNIFIPNPTWGNHVAIMKNSGLNVVRYRYFNAETKGFDYEGMMADIIAADDGSCFLLHACAHNPTGRVIGTHHSSGFTLSSLLQSKPEFCASYCRM